MDLIPKGLTPDHEQHDLKKVRKGFKIQTQKRIKGHKLWDFNPHSGDLIDIPFPQATIKFNDDLSHADPRGAIAEQPVKEGHMYFQCLNRKNAIRKLNNRGYAVKKKVRQNNKT